MNAFDNIVNTLERESLNGRPQISKQEFQDWQRQWILDAVGGLRLGQSFCNYFNITLGPLYYFKDNSISLRWIKDNYLKDKIMD